MILLCKKRRLDDTLGGPPFECAASTSAARNWALFRVYRRIDDTWNHNKRRGKRTSKFGDDSNVCGNSSVPWCRRKVWSIGGNKWGKVPSEWIESSAFPHALHFIPSVYPKLVDKPRHYCLGHLLVVRNFYLLWITSFGRLGSVVNVSLIMVEIPTTDKPHLTVFLEAV